MIIHIPLLFHASHLSSSSSSFFKNAVFPRLSRFSQTRTVEKRCVFQVFQIFQVFPNTDR